jgi:hypothetical protein
MSFVWKVAGSKVELVIYKQLKVGSLDIHFKESVFGLVIKDNTLCVKVFINNYKI